MIAIQGNGCFRSLTRSLQRGQSYLGILYGVAPHILRAQYYNVFAGSATDREVASRCDFEIQGEGAAERWGIGKLGSKRKSITPHLSRVVSGVIHGSRSRPREVVKEHVVHMVLVICSWRRKRVGGATILAIGESGLVGGVIPFREVLAR